MKVKGIILLHTVANRRASVISTSRAGVTVYRFQTDPESTYSVGGFLSSKQVRRERDKSRRTKAKGRM